MAVLQLETLQRTTIRLSGIFIKAFKAKLIFLFIHSFVLSFLFLLETSVARSSPQFATNYT